MKKTIKRLLKVFLYVVIIMMVIPYFIPTNFANEIPCLPFENSVFYRTSDDVILHTQVYKPESELKGKVLMIHGLVHQPIPSHTMLQYCKTMDILL